MNLTPLDFFYQWEEQTPDDIFLKQPIHGIWHHWTYKKAGNEIRCLAAALKNSGIPEGSNIAILSKNCAHWIMADLAIMMAGHVSVPIYATLSAEGIKFILDHSECKGIFVGKLDQYQAQQLGIEGNIVKISFPYYGPEEGLQWNDLVQAHKPLPDFRPEANAIATIMYSSGTTGTPKGVLLTFGAFGFVGDKVRQHLSVKKTERFFSYLPLSHIAERALMEMVVLASGSSIAFAESLDKFTENLQYEKPTIFGGVPRIYAKFQEGILSKLPQKRLDTLLSVPILNRIIRNAIRKKLGLSHAKVIVSGAAPIPVSLLRWFKRLGIEIGEIYGMTENTAFSHANYGELRIGSVGQPWPEAEVRLTGEGEVLIKHQGLMKGYYKDPETTTLVFTEDGFLRTGDKGEIDASGFLTITGRIKDQFKTDKAKFVAPAPIEMQLLENTDLAQACVVGMGIPQPIALIVLSPGGKTRSRNEIEESLRKQIADLNSKLEHYERLEKIIILKEDWTIENNLLTPSLKLKRNELEKLYQEKYRAWYDQTNVVLWE